MMLSPLRHCRAHVRISAFCAQGAIALNRVFAFFIIWFYFGFIDIFYYFDLLIILTTNHHREWGLGIGDWGIGLLLAIPAFW
jgi:hypothetical protein